MFLLESLGKKNTPVLLNGTPHSTLNLCQRNIFQEYVFAGVLTEMSGTNPAPKSEIQVFFKKKTSMQKCVLIDTSLPWIFSGW